MTSDFSELQSDLNRQRQELAALANFHARMASADFKPIEHPVENFTGYEVPMDIYDYIQNVMPLNTAEYRMYSIGIAIEQLRAAMVLIETQAAYQRKVPSSDASIVTAIGDDQEGFAELLKETFDLNSRSNEDNLPATLDQNSFFKAVTDITQEYTDIAEGKISDSLAAQDSGQLLNKIYELRVYFADLSLKRTEAAIENTGTNLEAALLLKKSLDERIIEPSFFTDQMIERIMRETGDRLNSLASCHSSIHGFLGQTHEMDQDNDGLQDFEPDTYTSAPILAIAKFTP